MKAPKLSLRTCFKPFLAFLALHRARRAFPFVSFGNGLPCPRQADNNTRAAFELWRSHDKNTHIPYIRNHRYLKMGIHIYNPVIRSKIEVWRSGGCQACANTRTPPCCSPAPPPKRQALARTPHQSKTAAPTTTWHTVPQEVKALPKHRYRDLSFPLAVDREARLAAGRAQQTQTHVFLFASEEAAQLTPSAER